MKLILLALAAAALSAQLVPESYDVPTSHQTAKFRLEPLGPKLVKVDYEAYMSSIDHLRSTFSGGGWPSPGITMTDAMKDMEGEEARFKARKSFAYGVLTPDGGKELGSVYVRPSKKAGYDAVVAMWVTKEMFDKGFEAELAAEMKRWIAAKWPFEKVAYLGHGISKDEFAKLPDKK